MVTHIPIMTTFFDKNGEATWAAVAGGVTGVSRGMLDLSRDINPMRAEIAELKSRLQKILASLDEQSKIAAGAAHAPIPSLSRPAGPSPLLNRPASPATGFGVTASGAPSPLKRR